MQSLVPDRYRLIAETFYRPADCMLDFSEHALVEAFERETFGASHDMSKNGYAFGKKAFDITVAAWREDIADGLFTKYEYLQEYEEDSFEYDFIWNVIKDFPVGTFFAYKTCSF